MTVCALLLAGLLGAGSRLLAQPAESPFPGMDERVNVRLAQEAGADTRAPLLDTENLGELWNLMLLAAGGICGFVVGRYWDRLFGRPK